ncbi:hypothetical protein MPER_00260, partial [Moniliophthora perniciosa FA553]
MEKNDPYRNVTAESDPKKKKTRKRELMKIEKEPIAQMDWNAAWQIAQDHLLHCLLGPDAQITDEILESFEIIDNVIFEHAKVRIRYTTYDLRKDIDSINPSNHADFICLSQEAEDSDQHPYLYGR